MIDNYNKVLPVMREAKNLNWHQKILQLTTALHVNKMIWATPTGLLKPYLHANVIFFIKFFLKIHDFSWKVLHTFASSRIQLFKFHHAKDMAQHDIRKILDHLTGTTQFYERGVFTGEIKLSLAPSSCEYKNFIL